MLVPVSARATELTDVRWALPVFLRVLSLDTKFAEHVAGDFIILVPAPSGLATERSAVAKAAAELKVGSVKGHALKFVEAEVSDKAALAKAMKDSQANAVFVVPNLPKELVKAVIEVAAQQKAYTMALRDDMIEDGVLLGVMAKGEMRRVLMNTKAALELRVSFNDDVLKYVKTVP